MYVLIISKSAIMENLGRDIYVSAGDFGEFRAQYNMIMTTLHVRAYLYSLRGC